MKSRRPRTTPARRARSRECRAIFAALSEFVDGTLPASACQKLREHLKGCSPCIAYLDSLQKTVDLCQAYQTPAAPPPSPAVRRAILRAFSKRVARP